MVTARASVELYSCFQVPGETLEQQGLFIYPYIQQGSEESTMRWEGGRRDEGKSYNWRRWRFYHQDRDEQEKAVQAEWNHCPGLHTQSISLLSMLSHLMPMCFAKLFSMTWSSSPLFSCQQSYSSCKAWLIVTSSVKSSLIPWSSNSPSLLRALTAPGLTSILSHLTVTGF